METDGVTFEFTVMANVLALLVPHAFVALTDIVPPPSEAPKTIPTLFPEGVNVAPVPL